MSSGDSDVQGRTPAVMNGKLAVWMKQIRTGDALKTYLDLVLIIYVNGLE